MHSIWIYFLISSCFLCSVSESTLIECTVNGTTVNATNLSILNFNTIPAGTTSIESYGYDKRECVVKDLPECAHNYVAISEVRDLPILNYVTLHNFKFKDGIPRFWNLPMINEIIIRGCSGVVHIQEEKLSSLALGALMLHSNNIRSIDDGAFGTELVELNLDGNLLTAFDSDWFKDPPKLEILYLQSNKIKYIQNYAFEKFKHIYWIKLEGNQIAYIGDHAFPARPRFSLIDLGYNNLTELHPTIFPIVNVSINSLSIFYNNITFISNDFLRRVYIESINIGRNPWKCACYDLIRDKIEGYFVKDESSDLRCVESNPPELVCNETVDRDIIRMYLNHENLRPPDRGSLYAVEGRPENF